MARRVAVMARVQMLLHITGGRADGTEWPHAGGFLSCEEREARELVAGGMARWLPGDAGTVTVPPGTAQLAAETTAAAPAGDTSPAPENGPESDGKPRVRDPKDVWEMHAITLGATPEMVAAMTKSDLIAQYGSM